MKPQSALNIDGHELTWDGSNMFFDGKSLQQPKHTVKLQIGGKHYICMETNDGDAKIANVSFKETEGKFIVGERITNASNPLGARECNSAIIEAIAYESSFNGTMKLRNIGDDFKAGNIIGCTGLCAGEILSL